MVRNEPRSKTTFGMSLALPQRARQPWHRLQTEGTREEEHSASSCGLPTSLLPCGGMEGCPNQRRAAIMEFGLQLSQSTRRCSPVSLRRALLHSQLLSSAAPAHFRTLQVSRSKRGMASKERKHRCWEIQEGGSSRVFKYVAA